ncbi:hypothetical protein TWF694_000987 [Orbilia ellipsospora]|uniref:Cysteine-rich transmembrane CYSTM domain-containing protein n=1 Tax=Orbilia ellipsospora TaxID=2528407 RepID=A0AAV9XQ79_9PEZI
MQEQQQQVNAPAPAPAMEMTPQQRTPEDTQREAEPVKLGLRGGRDRGCIAGCLAALCICCACDACIDCVDDCCCC